jgi:polar amino acid transport system ATP-binding protein
MGFARSVADRVVFMAEGRIVEEAPPEEFFANPKNETTRNFLGQILVSHHQARPEVQPAEAAAAAAAAVNLSGPAM